MQEDVATAYAGYANFSDSIITINGEQFPFNGRARSAVGRGSYAVPGLADKLHELGLEYGGQQANFLKGLYWYDNPIKEWERNLSITGNPKIEQVRDSIQKFIDVYKANNISVDKSGLKGVTHVVNVDDDCVFIPEYDPISSVPEAWALLKDICEDANETGGQLYDRLSYDKGGELEASQYLKSIGIDGMSYFGTLDRDCLVIYNNDKINITTRKER